MDILTRRIETERCQILTFNKTKEGLHLCISLFDDEDFNDRDINIGSVEALEALKDEINKAIKELKNPL